MKTFAERLKTVMSARNITQSELSKLTGLGKSSISQYLAGKNVPKENVKRKLIEVLDVSAAYFEEYLDCSDDINTSQGLKALTVEQAAKALGKSQQFVRVALQRGIAPFGFAVKVTGEKWSYHISQKRFEEYTAASIEE